MTHTGFIVHGYVDFRKDRIYLTGRLEDGRSFAVSESRYRPSLMIRHVDRDRLRSLSELPPFTVEESPLRSFERGEPLVLLRFRRYRDRSQAAGILRAAGIGSPDGDMKAADVFLLEKGIRGPLAIQGEARPGRNVDLVFPDPELESGSSEFRAPLRIASIDIETDETSKAIRALAMSSYTLSTGKAKPGSEALHAEKPRQINNFLGLVYPFEGTNPTVALCFYPSEKELLSAFHNELLCLDPDVLTGWNFLDFDFRRLSERFEALGLPFTLGRAGEEAKYLAGEGRRSAAAVVPGRQVVDALRAVRAGVERFEDYTLETVAQGVLGEGKLVHSQGEEKLAELDALYRDDPVLFASYCQRDADLVLRILEKTGLFSLAVERSALMGISLDKAWTSVAGFERIYASQLYRRALAPPPVEGMMGRNVSGAAGGTVLDPDPGLFHNVIVFDFRSLYPTIIRTFNIDPLAYEQALRGTDNPIRAPNGAAFSREPGILPELIGTYFAARRKALDAGDENGAYVYKILMNSFYGVLGTSTCRYGRTELAGAITSFARKWLHFSRDWFLAQGYRVLYGDTDSLFVETRLGDDASHAAFSSQGIALAGALNGELASTIQGAYGLPSYLELRFEKAYRRFLIPPLRNSSEGGDAKGRAKGYGGYLLNDDTSLVVEVKGMEAVRSDSTPLARRFQLEALELVFRGEGEKALLDLTMEIAKKLRTGELDGELVYRKRLTRPPEAYTASTPPQVKAARALGWKGRKGTVEYVWTTAGAEPVQALGSPLDYDHYLQTQLFPVARSIAAAAFWDCAPYSLNQRERSALAAGQMDLFFP